MQASLVSRLALTLTLLVGSVPLVGCATNRVDQQLSPLPKLLPGVAPLAIEIRPAGFPNENLIFPGLFPEDTSDHTPLERLTDAITAAFRSVPVFDVRRVSTVLTPSDADYAIEFAIKEMKSEDDAIGWFARLLGEEVNRYVIVSFTYWIKDRNGRDLTIESEATDKFLITMNPRFDGTIGAKLNLSPFFEKVEQNNIVFANGTMRGIHKFITEVDRTLDAELAKSKATPRPSR